MRLVALITGDAGSTHDTMEYRRMAMRDCLNLGETPIAPQHLYMDRSDVWEMVEPRVIEQASLDIIEMSMAVAVYQNYPLNGMAVHLLEEARDFGINIEERSVPGWSANLTTGYARSELPSGVDLVIHFDPMSPASDRAVLALQKVGVVVNSYTSKGTGTTQYHLKTPDDSKAFVVSRSSYIFHYASPVAGLKHQWQMQAGELFEAWRGNKYRNRIVGVGKYTDVTRGI